MRTLMHDPSRPGVLEEVETARREWELKQSGWTIVSATRLGSKCEQWRKRAKLSVDDAVRVARVRWVGERPSGAALKRLFSGEGEALGADATRQLACAIGVPVAWLCTHRGATPRPHAEWQWEEAPRTRRTARAYKVSFADGEDFVTYAYDPQHAKDLVRDMGEVVDVTTT